MFRKISALLVFLVLVVGCTMWVQQRTIPPEMVTSQPDEGAAKRQELAHDRVEAVGGATGVQATALKTDSESANFKHDNPQIKSEVGTPGSDLEEKKSDIIESVTGSDHIGSNFNKDILKSGVVSSQKLSRSFGNSASNADSGSGRVDFNSKVKAGDVKSEASPPHDTGLGKLAGGGSVFPEFPWPPPMPSARQNLPRQLFQSTGVLSPNLKTVGEALSSALVRAGYAEQAYYRAPNGFALVARIERIASDGHNLPSPERFVILDADLPFSLERYIAGLFFAPEGYYRQIVFVVTDAAFVANSPPITATEATALLRDGMDRLPPEYSVATFGPNHEVSALIYEFRKGKADRDVSVLVPGRLGAQQHLDLSGISTSLRIQ